MKLSPLHFPNFENKQECVDFIEEHKDNQWTLRFFREEFAKEFKHRIFCTNYIITTVSTLKECSEILIACSERIEQLTRRQNENL